MKILFVIYNGTLVSNARKSQV